MPFSPGDFIKMLNFLEARQTGTGPACLDGSSLLRRSPQSVDIKPFRVTSVMIILFALEVSHGPLQGTGGDSLLLPDGCPAGEYPCPA